MEYSAPQAPPDSAVAEMYSLIGLKDPSTRQVFEIKLLAEKPAASADVLKCLMELLRGRVRSEEIDAVASAARSHGFVTRPLTPGLGQNDNWSSTTYGHLWRPLLGEPW